MSVHYFDTYVAKEIGILPAILLQNIEYWCSKNKANEKHFHDGYYWTYNSTKAFSQLFSYASKRQIEIALNKLRELGYIVVGNYNQVQYDRTLWYAITENGISILRTGEMEITKNGNGNHENVTPIPYNKPNCKTTNNKPNKKEELFDCLIFDFTENQELRKAINDFIEMRKIIKSAMTIHALELMLNKLNKLGSNDDEKIQILEESIMNNWKGIFELKSSTNNSKQKQQSFEDKWKDA